MADFQNEDQVLPWELSDDRGQNSRKDKLWVPRLGSTDH